MGSTEILAGVQTEGWDPSSAVSKRVWSLRIQCTAWTWLLANKSLRAECLVSLPKLLVGKSVSSEVIHAGTDPGSIIKRVEAISLMSLCMFTAVWQSGVVENTEETLPKLVACGLEKQCVAIYPCQPQALLTIFNESPLLLLLPSAMTFTI